MRTTSTVARWTWGRDDETADALVCCLRDLLTAYQVLAAHRFAVDAPAIHVSVSEAGTSNSLLFEGELAVPTHAHEAAKAAPQLAEQVREAMRAGEVGSVDAYAECSGMVVTGADAGDEERQDGLFRLGASSFADFVTVDLVTHTDVWLPYDLRGRPQPEVYGANGARLSAALRELAEALESETDPDDPTYFAKPTATGAENFFAADGSASDVWGSFEVPTRYDIFTHAPGFGRIGYRRTANGEVQPYRSSTGAVRCWGTFGSPMPRMRQVSNRWTWATTRRIGPAGTSARRPRARPSTVHSTRRTVDHG